MSLFSEAKVFVYLYNDPAHRFRIRLNVQKHHGIFSGSRRKQSGSRYSQTTEPESVLRLNHL